MKGKERQRRRETEGLRMGPRKHKCESQSRTLFALACDFLNLGTLRRDDLSYGRLAPKTTPLSGCSPPARAHDLGYRNQCGHWGL